MAKKNEMILAADEGPLANTNLPKNEQYDRAKSAYLDYVPVRLIASTYGLKAEEIAVWINEPHNQQPAWRTTREELETTTSKEYFKTRSHRVHELVNLSIVALRRCLNSALSESEISLKDGANIANILGQLDKITRLDENKPTDIVEHTLPATLEEVRALVVKYDPFLSPGEDPKILEGVVVKDTDDSGNK